MFVWTASAMLFGAIFVMDFVWFL